MIFSAVLASSLLALSVVAAPVAEPAPVELDKRAISDVDILQYALTLEHLENAFYSGALSQFDAGAFKNAGYPSWVRERFQQIADHEAAHVAFLSKALGDAATKPCNYSFPYNDPKSFAGLSAVLEGVGVAAYLGAAPSITNPAYLAAAGAILTVETRHVAWVQSAVMTNAAWSGAFETPLDFDQVYSLAAGLITSCPDSNPMLPVKAFPTLTASMGSSPGSSVSFTFNSTGYSGQPLYAAFFSGLDTKFAPLDGSMSATVPGDVIGTVYVVITTNGTAVTDDTTVAGPAILEYRLPESAA